MNKKKKCIGLACLSKRRRRQIAAMGARTVNALGIGYKFTSTTGRAAAKKRYGTA